MELQPPDQCDQCDFDAAEWNHEDTVNTLRHATDYLRLWSDPVPDEGRNRRVSSEVWSVAEYVDHVRENFFSVRFLVDTALGDPDVDMGPEVEPRPPGDHRRLSFDDCLAAVGVEAEALTDRLAGLTEAEWERAVLLAGRRHTVAWASRHAAHDLWHHLGDIAGLATELGAGAAAQAGMVAQISVSDGGVPKQAVDAATITRRGVEGDRQQLRQHHGRPWQALCLWSSEVIDALVAEGHPVAAGNAGENLTLGGFDWSALQAGAVLTVGEVRCQLSAPATPCAKNKQWFADRESSRIDHDLHPGWSRWYATVLQGGRVTTGDPVTVQPAPAPVTR